MRPSVAACLLVLLSANVAVIARGDANSEPSVSPDLSTISPAGHGWLGAVAATKLIEKDGKPAIEFNSPNSASVVWLDGFDFTDGVIEFDAKGRSAPVQGSFVGMAFHVRDAKTYDAVYFRAFNFRASDAERKSHSVQYISEPAWPWQKLRESKPGHYEKALDPAPDGDSWFHARIVIAKPTVKVYVDGQSQPSLVVDQLADRRGGSVGLWCNGYGAIANVTITKTK